MKKNFHFEVNMNIINSIVEKLEKPKPEPLKYISKSSSKNSDLQNVVADAFKLYINKCNPKNKKKKINEIFIKNFDSEQIWQQMELKNGLLDCYVPSLANILGVEDAVKLPYRHKSDLSNSTSKEDRSGSITVENKETTSEEDDDEKDLVSDDSEEDDTTLMEKCLLDDLEEDDTALMEKPLIDDSSEVDEDVSTGNDTFFNLNEMESFLDKAEKESLDGNQDIDYFTDIPSDDKDGTSQSMYKDFFEDPLPKHKSCRPKEEDNEDSVDEEDDDNVVMNKITKGKKRNIEDSDELQNSKKVRFITDDETSDEEAGKSDIRNQSSFEKKHTKLKEQIAKMEEDALSEKPWPQRGEVDAQGRPINSLLEEIVDVDLSSRPAPVMTEKVTMDLETVITTRIKNKAFDDVERKIKPVHVQHELKKQLVLNQEKSKLSLAQIYEQEFINKQNVDNNQETTESKEITEQKEKILNMMKSVFKKLDILSNFHYTPKPPIEELKIISNAPTISVEEALPTAVAEGSTLAPQEIAGSKKKVLIGKDERTKTDKLRERRKKKAFLSKKFQKAKNKGDPLSKILKSKKVSLIESTGNDKAVKTSSQFFTRLQEKSDSGILTKKPKEKPKKVKPHK